MRGISPLKLYWTDIAQKRKTGTDLFNIEEAASFPYEDRASHNDGSELFEYDSTQNRLIRIGEQTWYSSGGGDLLPPQWYPGTSWYAGFSYDAAGNQTLKSVEIPDCSLVTATPPDPDYLDCTVDIKDWVFDYSAYNQPRSVTLPDLQQTLYQYNALKQRIRKTLPGGVVTHYLYGLSGELLAELNGLNGVIKEYVYLQGTLLAVRDFSSGVEQLYYVHSDHLGTSRLLTDVAGQTVWSGDFDPFGKTAAIDEDPDGDGASVHLNIRFPGQYYDAETGLHYNWNRYYDPETGRYTSSDPIGFEGGLNTYAYAGGNPVGAVDPEGLFEIRGGFDSRIRNKGLTFSQRNSAWKAYLKTPAGKREKILNELKRRFQSKLDASNCQNKEELQKIFNNWVVFVDPNIDDLLRKVRGDEADTSFSTQETRFNAGFFELGSKLSTVAHEFRHLMKKNNDLFTPAYRRDRVRGADTSHHPIEKDANAWARKFLN